MSRRTYPVLPAAGETQLRIFSGIFGCDYRVTTNLPPPDDSFILEGIDFYSSGNLDTVDGSFALSYNIQILTLGCTVLDGGVYTLYEGTAHTLFLRPIQAVGRIWYEDELQKSSKSQALVRTLANLPATTRIVWRELRSGNNALDLQARNHELHELNTIEYEVQAGQFLVHQQKLRPGGVYALVIGSSSEGIVSGMFEVTKPNSMSMLWLIPQYVVMTLGEVMFSMTGLQFSYAQAPSSMKALIQASWLLTVAFGNIIVVIVAELKFFNSQASEFFLFAALMLVDMLIFMWFAYYYVPYDEVLALKQNRQRKMI